MAPVTSVTFVPAGELGPQEILITSAGDWTVRMWQREGEGEVLGKYRSYGKVNVDHSGWVFSVCYISKEVCLSLGVPNPILVTASGDKTLKVIYCVRARFRRGCGKALTLLVSGGACVFFWLLSPAGLGPLVVQQHRACGMRDAGWAHGRRLPRDLCKKVGYVAKLFFGQATDLFHGF